MNSVWIIALSLIIFSLAYKLYGTFIARRVFCANPANPVPSEELKDDLDYVPTNKEVLFGHHFASIAGTGPIVGPAIAIIWGWLPALLWVVLGSIFAGAVHDYASLIISVREKGQSIGELSKKVINPRIKILFLFVILFSLWVVLAIFGMVMAIIFQMYPQSVFPVWIQIPIAMAIGWLAYRKKFNIAVMSVIAIILMYSSIVIGVHFPLTMPTVWLLSPMMIWIILLFIYCFFASVLPVWILLQPRDYVNAHQLIIGLILLSLGVLVSHPKIVAPVMQLAPIGAPSIFPFLFITIACGAISGFHSLVSSGTSSKQLKNEEDVKFIGYGGMLTEGFLSVLVIIAVAAGIGMHVKTASGEVLQGTSAWNYYYSTWQVAQGLVDKITAFVDGAANMLKTIGISAIYGQAIMGVLIASFVGTTLDTAARIQRYIVEELAGHYNIKPLRRRYPATLFVVLAAGILAFAQGGGKGALILWPLFGATNQLLAALVLLVASVYLIRLKAKSWPTVVPMVFMIVTSSWAMLINLVHFFTQSAWHLFIIGLVILFLEVWMIIEAVRCVRITRKDRCACSFSHSI